MCTLTWTGRVSTVEAAGSPGTAGYSLWFNRDERLTRAPELPPRVQTTPEGVRYIAPEDSEAGGTWILVNEFGLTVALLNGYIESRGPEREIYESRGTLVRSLAGLMSPLEALGQLSPRDLAIYRPAVVVLKAPGMPALIARWDGLTVAIDMDGERQLPVTSSSYEQDDVQRRRRDLYRTLMAQDAPGSDGSPPAPECLAAFQNYVDPDEGPTAFTPTMARSDAATRSQCQIEVSGESVRFMYRPGPPHVTDVSAVLDLPRCGIDGAR